MNRVLDPSGELVIGRFGWKANVATVEQQNAGAFHGDIGITSRLHPEQDCTATQAECSAAIDGGQPELDDAKLERVTFYTRTLAVPARRDVGDPDTDAGARVFDELGCSSCHRPEMPHRAGPGRGDVESDDPALHRPVVARHGSGTRRRPT